MRQPDSSHGPFPEKTTVRLRFPALTDENGVVVPGSALTTATYTLYDEATKDAVGGGIINSRDQVNCKPSFSEAGVLTLVLLPADMVMVAQTNNQERHRLLLQWTYASGVGRGSYEAQIIVSNVEKVA